MSQESRKVQYLPLAELKADPRNPKAHDEEVIDASIGRFGVLDLIVLDERTGNIVSGHGRQKALAAMEERGESAPEGVQVDAEGRWLVPVVTGWASRTDSEAGAALIALNRTTELGGWVDEDLLTLLDDLSEMDDGLAGVGFTEEDRAALAHLSYEHTEDGPRDLDELYEQVGDPTEEDSYVKVTLSLPVDLAEELEDVLSAAGSREAAVRSWVAYASEALSSGH